MGNACSCERGPGQSSSTPDTPRANAPGFHPAPVAASGGAAGGGKGGAVGSVGDTTRSSFTLQFEEAQDEDSEDEHDDDEVEDLPSPPSAYLNNKKGRHSVSAEAYGEWNKKGNFKAPVYPKTEEQKAKITNKLEENFLFSNLDVEDMDTVIDAFQELKVVKGTKIITQGDDGDRLYLIQKGNVDVFKKIGDAPEKFMINMKEGDAFGELALMYNAPRAATVVAATAEVELWALDRESFNHIVKDAAAKKREMYEDVLKEVEILKEMDPYERSKVADAIKSENFKDGDVIIREGDSGDTFYMLIDGAAEALKEGKVVMTYRKGHYFGELALLKNQPRAATVKAKGNCKVAHMNRRSFQRLLGPVELVLMRNMDIYKKTLEGMGMDTKYLEK